jgi:hypothetical protein
LEAHLQRDLLGRMEGDQEARDGQKRVILAAAAIALQVVPAERQQLLAVLLQQRRGGADQAARQLQQPRLQLLVVRGCMCTVLVSEACCRSGASIACVICFVAKQHSTAQLSKGGTSLTCQVVGVVGVAHAAEDGVQHGGRQHLQRRSRCCSSTP